MVDMAFISEKKEGDFYVSTYRHRESLYESVKGVSVENFGMVVPLAVAALEHLNKTVNTIESKEMIAAEVRRKTDTFELQKSRLEEDKKLALLKKEREYEGVVASLKQSEEGLQRENLRLREQYETMKNSIEDATRFSLEQNDAHHRTELQRLRDTLENQARERVEYCHREHKENIELIRTLFEERAATYRKELEKTLGSSTKGKQGEKEFEELIALYTDWAKVHDVSKSSHSTDIRCKIRKCSTLFEVKKYSDDIPHKEVVKFERDMEENQDCPLGVFISLHTNISGKKSGGFISCAWSAKSQLLIYVNSFYNHSAEDVLMFVDMCADFAWRIFGAARDTPEESELTAQLQNRIEQAKIFVEKDMKRLSDLVTKMNHNKKFLIDSITKQNADCVGDIQLSKSSLQSVLEVLLGKSEKSEKSEKCEKSDESESPAIIRVDNSQVMPTPPPEQETPKKKGGARKKSVVAAV